MLPVEVLVPGANSRSTCKHCGIYKGPSLLEPYKSHNNIYIYKAAYDESCYNFSCLMLFCDLQVSGIFVLSDAPFPVVSLVGTFVALIIR